MPELTRLAKAIDLPEFRPPLWLRSGFVQTLAMPFSGGCDFTDRDDVRRIIVRYEDDTDDSTDAYFAAAGSDESKDRPLVVLFHGLGGSASSAYVSRSAANLLSGGFDVLAPNFRGSGTAASLAAEYHHPGRSEDIRLFFDALQSQQEDFADRPLVVVGFSLGGHVLLKYLADEHSSGHSQNVLAGITVSAPLSLRETSLRLSAVQNWAFCHHILGKMKDEYSRPNGRATDEQRETMAAARTVWQFDAAFTSGYLGYDSAGDFYDEMSAVEKLHDIDVPTVTFHSKDDPFVPHEHYQQPAFKEDGHLARVLTNHGGHVGFFDARGETRWLDNAILKLLEREFWLAG